MGRHAFWTSSAVIFLLVPCRSALRIIHLLIRTLVFCSSCAIRFRMFRPSDVNAIIPSTVSVGVGTDPTLEMVEKVDRAVQTDDIDDYPLRTSGSIRVESDGESVSKRHRRDSIVGTEEVPSSVVISIESAPRGPRTGCFVCGSRGHYRKDCPRRAESRSIRVAQQKRSGASGLDLSGSSRERAFD